MYVCMCICVYTHIHFQNKCTLSNKQKLTKKKYIKPDNNRTTIYILLGIHPKEMQSVSQADICLPMFTAALLLTNKKCRNLYLSLGE